MYFYQVFLYVVSVSLFALVGTFAFLIIFHLTWVSFPPCFRFIFLYLDFIWWGLVGCQEQSNTFIFLPLEENIPKFTICLFIFYLLQKFMCHHKSLNFVHTWKHVFTQKYVRWIWIRFNSHICTLMWAPEETKSWKTKSQSEDFLGSWWTLIRCIFNAASSEHLK